METIINWHDVNELLPVCDNEPFYKEDGKFSRKVFVCLEDGSIFISKGMLINHHPVYSYKDGRIWFVWQNHALIKPVLWADIPVIKLKKNG